MRSFGPRRRNVRRIRGSKPAHGVETAPPHPADRRYLPQPVLSRVEQRDRARARARSRPHAAPARLGRQRLLLCAVRGADPRRPVVRPVRRAPDRGRPVAARHAGLAVDRPCHGCRRPDRRPHHRRCGLRRLVHVGGVPVLALVRAGEARHTTLLGVRGLEHRHPGGGHAARLDRGHGRLAQRLPGPRRRHAAGRRRLPGLRARPAAGISRPRARARVTRPDPARSVGGVADARPRACALHALLRLRHDADGAGRVGRSLSPRRAQARRRRARQRAARHGRGAAPGHPGLWADGSRAAVAQAGGVRRGRDLHGAAGNPGGAVPSAALARGLAADRLLLLLRLRHRDRGAGPYAVSRPAGRPRRHHRQHGAMPWACRAARRGRLHRRGLRRG